jgi:hypothetical protein
MASATAKANGRDVIAWKDIPLTQGIQKCMHLALARTFTILEPGVKNPSTDHWERSFHLFDLLL